MVNSKVLIETSRHENEDSVRCYGSNASFNVSLIFKITIFKITI